MCRFYVEFVLESPMYVTNPLNFMVFRKGEKQNGNWIT